mmetsp:Transcript_63538/g.175188  ORF Transcript_63538/g.175188 Transcript_63538/m.175188 type:complete len:209 (+) Transcript_63538:150-776(+)
MNTDAKAGAAYGVPIALGDVQEVSSMAKTRLGQTAPARLVVLEVLRRIEGVRSCAAGAAHARRDFRQRVDAPRLSRVQECARRPMQQPFGGRAGGAAAERNCPRARVGVRVGHDVRPVGGIRDEHLGLGVHKPSRGPGNGSELHQLVEGRCVQAREEHVRVEEPICAHLILGRVHRGVAAGAKRTANERVGARDAMIFKLRQPRVRSR